MKKSVIVLSVMALSTLVVKADPARKVVLSYANGKLKIVAEHPVSNVKTHYIDQINIEVDGKEVKVIKLKSQSSPEAAVEELALPEIKSGSTVKVKTRCNEFGTKSGKLVIK
jgi:desulfoferrodoxin (superoxide reductase-like protein)